MIVIINFSKETVIMNQNVMYFFRDYNTNCTDYCSRSAELYITILLEGQFPKNAEKTDWSEQVCI